MISRELCWLRGPTSITSKGAKWWADSWAQVFYSMLRRDVNTREMDLTLLLYISDSNLDSFFKYASNNKNVYFFKKIAIVYAIVQSIGMMVFTRSLPDQSSKRPK